MISKSVKTMANGNGNRQDVLKQLDRFADDLDDVTKQKVRPGERWLHKTADQLLEMPQPHYNQQSEKTLSMLYREGALG